MSDIEILPTKYVIGDKEYARVTKILDVIAKPEFYRWYASLGFKRCETIKENRASFGTRMHKYFQRFLLNENIDDDLEDDIDEMKVSMIKFKDFVSQYVVDIHALELHLHSKYGYAGTCDAVLTLDLFDDEKPKKMLVDWKSGKRIYNTAYLQLAAYLFAYEEMYGRKLAGGCIVRIRDGKIEHQCIEREDLKREFSVFLSALNIYKWVHNIEWVYDEEIEDE